MMNYESHCVCCDLPCMIGCRLKNVPHYYCDNCGEEVPYDELFYGEGGEEYCQACYDVIYEEE